MATAQQVQDWNDAYSKAHTAAMYAGEKALPQPMTVTDGVTDWYVSEGVCGFAWVSLTPANTALARWLKTSMGWRKGYPKGIQMWVGQFGQSYERKMAYATEFARVFSMETGVAVTSSGRLD